MAKLDKRYLYEHFSARLLAVCIRYTGDRQIAEDVLHDSFISIFKNLDRLDYRGEAALYGWMKSIAVHKCIDRIRAEAKDPVTLDENIDLPGEDPPADVGKIPPDVLIRCIGELPEGYRTVFNLFCLDGRSHAEIAEMLGIKEKTSSSQYFRARALLAKKLKDYLSHEQ